MTHKYSLILTIFSFLLILLPQLNPVRATEIRTYPVTPQQTFTQNPYLNTVYHYQYISVPYQDGEVYISGAADGLAPVQVGEQIEFQVQQSNKFYRHYIDCTPTTPKPPLNITHLLAKGQNTVLVRFIRNNYCTPYNTRTIGPVYIVHYDTYEPSAQFLDLPWDYASRAMNFSEAAQSMTSWFDHEYPLLSSNLQEPNVADNTVVSYDLLTRTEKEYSNHDGYDWALQSKLKLGDPVLAAAPGYASYVNTCSACGNAIHIDHQNGYQTRYYHMQYDGLVINQPGQQTWVTNKQHIGNVGAEGNVTGAHLHFMVVHDKNNDGNFEDNIPDGVVDPFGWKPLTTDPWEIYSFNYAGQDRTGAKSKYLWKYPVGDYRGTIANDQISNHILPRVKFDFPKNSLSRYGILHVQNLPPDSIVVFNGDNPTPLQSLGNILNATIKDALGSSFETLLKPFTLTFSFGHLDVSRFIPETVSIYSSSDDGVTWQKETTSIDPINKKAISNINHFSQFALMGEKLDNIAPVTIATLAGTLQEGSADIYLDEVTATVTSTDTPTEYSLGIEYILYKLELDGAAADWTQYTAPIVTEEPGDYTLSYYAVDKDGNVEEKQIIEFSIANIPTPTPTFEPTPTLTPTSAPSATATPTVEPTPTSLLMPTVTITPIKSPKSTVIPSPTTIRKMINTPTPRAKTPPQQFAPEINAVLKTIVSLIIKLFK